MLTGHLVHCLLDSQGKVHLLWAGLSKLVMHRKYMYNILALSILYHRGDRERAKKIKGAGGEEIILFSGAAEMENCEAGINKG